MSGEKSKLWERITPILSLLTGLMVGISLTTRYYDSDDYVTYEGTPPWCSSQAWVQATGGDWILTIQNDYLDFRPMGGMPLYQLGVTWENLHPGDVELVETSRNLEGWKLQFNDRPELGFGGYGYGLPPGSTATLRFRIKPELMDKALPAKVFLTCSTTGDVKNFRNSITNTVNLYTYTSSAPIKVADDLLKAESLSVKSFGMLYDGGSQSISLEGLPYPIMLIARVGFDQTDPVEIELVPETAQRQGLKLYNGSGHEKQLLHLLEQAEQNETNMTTRHMLSLMINTIRTRVSPEAEAWPQQHDDNAKLAPLPSVMAH